MKRLYTIALVGFLFLVGTANSVYGQQFSYNGMNFTNVKSSTSLPVGTQFLYDRMNFRVTKSSASGVGECEVFCCIDTSGVAIIPETAIYDNKYYTVTSIREGAFVESTLSSVSIPHTVTKIGKDAFNNCRLKSIIIPNSITDIGSDAFCGSDFESVSFENNTKIKSAGDGLFACCEKLLTIDIPDGITTIGYVTFAGCHSLNSVIIPSSVTVIGEYAFVDCPNLKNITIPSSVTTIANGAFSGCGFTSITIPPSVKTIEEGAFSNCHDLDTLTFSEHSSLEEIGDDAFLGCNNLKNFVLPLSLKIIGIGAFASCSSLTSIDIPNSVRKIRDNAFVVCTKLRIANISASVDSIGKIEFGDCPNLTEINIPDNSSLKTIADSAFFACGEVASINIPNSVEYIGDGAFEYCNSLQSINIPSSLTAIRKNVFHGCTNLQSAIIPQYVKSIGDDAFNNCSNLASVTFSSDLHLENIGKNAFMDCIKLQSLSIPKYVKTIGESAFQYCSSLESFDFNSNSVLEYISDNLFTGCKKLGTLVIPSSVKMIGQVAFAGCSNLTSVVIPGSVKNIGFAAFGGCQNLLSITIPNSVTNIGSGAFQDCTQLSSVTFEPIWKGHYSVKYIGEYAFANCVALTSIQIPEELDRIENYTFYGCTGLTEVNIPCTVMHIGDYAFYGCTGLTKASFMRHATVTTYLGKPANHDNLRSGSESDGVETIGVSAFQNCSKLQSVVIPLSVKSIGENAFAGCGVLAEIFVESPDPNDITTIANAFTNVKSDCVLHVPTGSIDKFKAVAPWSDFLAPKEIVEYNPVTILTLSSETLSLNPGQSAQLSASITPANATYKMLTWTSSDPEVAIVDANGNISAKGLGAAIISVTPENSGTTGTCTVTVNKETTSNPIKITSDIILPSVTGVRSNPAAGTYSLPVGDTFSFSLELDPEYSNSQIVVKANGEVVNLRPDGITYEVENHSTNPMKIEILGVMKNGETATEEIFGTEKIWTSGNRIVIHSAKQQTAQIISLTGATIYDQQIPAGDTQINVLTKGIYIVRLSDGTIEKVIL